MRAYLKGKIYKLEFDRIFEIGKNYHKYLYTHFKYRIKTKRLQKNFWIKSKKGK